METSKKARNFYNRFLQYESFQTSEGWQTPFFLISYIRPYLQSGESIIDIGCGPGLVGKELGKIGWQGLLIGVDIAETLLQQAQDKSIYNNCVHANAYRLPFINHCFDFVLSNAMVGLTGIRSIQEMCRLVKKGGYFACIASEIKSMSWCRNRFRKVCKFLEKLPGANSILYKDLGSGYSNTYDDEHFVLFFYQLI